MTTNTEIIEEPSLPSLPQGEQDEEPNADGLADGLFAHQSELDQIDEPSVDEEAAAEASATSADHLRGLVEALIFASDKPLKAVELARMAKAPVREVRPILKELSDHYAVRGVRLDEIAGGWAFRTAAAYAPFVRDMANVKPVRLTRAQVETLAIVAYRQPITRPEMEDIRGVDCGAVLKLLLERDLVRMMGKREEPGRPILYGTSQGFLELFRLRSLRDLPTLKEFTELSDESKAVAERELGETFADAGGEVIEDDAAIASEADEAAEPPAPIEGEAVITDGGPDVAHFDSLSPEDGESDRTLGDDAIEPGMA